MTPLLYFFKTLINFMIHNPKFNNLESKEVKKKISIKRNKQIFYFDEKIYKKSSLADKLK